MSWIDYLALGLLAVGALAALVWVSVTALEASFGDAPRYWCVVAFLAWGAVFGLFFAMMSKEPSGPCLRYTTGTAYNPATKTVMPYRTCAERGEWVEDPS